MPPETVLSIQPAVEYQVDQGGSLGVLSAGHTGDESDDAGSDVGTHGQEDALVESDETGYDHGDRDRSHHGRTLDYRSKERAEQNQNDRIAYSGEE